MVEGLFAIVALAVVVAAALFYTTWAERTLLNEEPRTGDQTAR